MIYLLSALPIFSLPLMLAVKKSSFSFILLSLNHRGLSNVVSHIYASFTLILYSNKKQFKQFRITLCFFFKLFGENRFIKSVRLLTWTIKSINPMQKYPHISELEALSLRCLSCFCCQ